VGSFATILGHLPFDKTKYMRRHHQNIIRAELINPDHLRLEPALMLSAHPDYRFMTPHERTELFRDKYIWRYGLAYRSNINFKDWNKMTGILRETTKMFSKGEKLAAKVHREYSSLWTARQKADRLGIDYSNYIGFCMYSHMEMNRKYIPRPNQLLTGAGAEIVLEYVLKKFSEEPSPRSYLAQYRNDFFIDLSAQNAHRIAVMADIKSCGTESFKDALANQLVPECKLIAEYSLEILEQKRQEIAASPINYFEPFNNPDQSDFFPGCFCMPFAYSEANKVCKECQFKKICSRREDKYTIKFSGSNKYVTRKREQDRIRQQRRRAKARLAKLSSPAAAP
jgi:hypothetical protein